MNLFRDHPRKYIVIEKLQKSAKSAANHLHQYVLLIPQKRVAESAHLIQHYCQTVFVKYVGILTTQTQADSDIVIISNKSSAQYAETCSNIGVGKKKILVARSVSKNMQRR